MKNVGEKPDLEMGTYRHYKGGIYDVLELACHTETLEWYVVYRSHEREEQELPSVWVRPLDMFMGTVAVGDVVVPRFRRIDG